jgi:PPOX class probable F420-dependent enzyme
MHEQIPLPDPTTPFGDRVRRRLRDDVLVWLTTVAADGTPQPNPVWFLWEGEMCLVYSTPGARRLRHVRSRPAVSLHFDHAGRDTVVITGRASIPADQPPADRVPAFLAKYQHLMGMGAGEWARHFSVPLRIELVRIRGHLAGQAARTAP